MSLKVVDPINVTDAVLTASDIPEPDTARGEVEWLPFEQKRFSEDFDPSTVGYSYVAAPALFFNGNYYILVRRGGFPNFNWAIVEVDSNFAVLSTNSIQVASNTPNNLGFSLDEATGKITLFFGDLQGGTLQYARVSVGNIIPSPAFTDISSVISAVFPDGVSGGVIFSLHGCESEGSFFFIARKDNDFKVHKFSVVGKKLSTVSVSAIDKLYPDGKGGAYGLIAFTPLATVTKVKITNISFDMSVKPYGEITSSQSWIAPSVDASFSGGVFIQTSVNTGTGVINAKAFNENTLLNIGHYKNGDRAILTSNHTVYQCLSDTFDNPIDGATEDATATWIEVGPTNKWAMFDDKNSTKTKSNTSFSVTLESSDYVMAYGLTGTPGLTSVRVRVYNSSNSLIYDKTQSAFDNIGASGDFIYASEDVFYKNIMHATDIPPTNNFRVVFTFNGTNIEIGNLTIGPAIELGPCLADSKSESLDLSEQKFDNFGNETYIERPIVTFATYETISNIELSNIMNRLLNSLRRKGCLWIGEVGYNQSIVTFGRIERDPIPYSMPTEVRYTIRVRGFA